MKTAIVITTIQVPYLLEEYANNFRKYGHKDIEFIVIGDLKTPAGIGKVIKGIKQTGFEAEYLDITKQREWMKQFPILEQMIPYNSDNRRNIGYLVAVERGADIIISIDDDNFVRKEDYLIGHQSVGTNQTLQTVHGFKGIHELVHKAYYSHEVGMRKPNHNIYQFVLQEQGIAPKEALFIDDRLDNIKGAREVGMQTFWNESIKI